MVPAAGKEMESLKSSYPEKYRTAERMLAHFTTDTGSTAFDEFKNSGKIKPLKGATDLYEFCWPRTAKGGVIRAIFTKDGNTLKILAAWLKNSSAGNQYKNLIALATARNV